MIAFSIEASSPVWGADETVWYKVFAILVSADGHTSIPLVSLEALIADAGIVIGAFTAIHIQAGRALAETCPIIDFVAFIADVAYERSFRLTSLALSYAALCIDAAYHVWL